MTKEEKKKQEEAVDEASAPAPVTAVDADDEEYASFMRDTLGDDYDEADEKKNRKSLMSYVKRSKDGTKRISDTMNKDARFAQAFSDVASGKRGSHGALARYFGKDYLTVEEGTPEYDEVMAAEEERLAEMAEAAKAKEEYKKNFEASLPVIDKFCEAHGYDPEEFRNKIWEEVATPIFEGRYDDKFLTLLDNAMNYDKDVADAMKAGEVKGRNTNINQMRENKGDGLPKIMGGGAPISSAPVRKAKTGGLLGEALGENM